MELLNKEFNYAIIGASNNPNKWGYKVSKQMQDLGYKIFPVNLHEQEILGNKCHPFLEDIKEKIDVVIFVVPPKVTLNVLKEVNRLGIKKVWMQPGSEDIDCINFCEENEIGCIHNSCIIMRSAE